MASLNKTRPSVPAPKTHGGAPAARITPLQKLRRTVMSCMLWEDTFYENGISVADRIVQCAAEVSPYDVAKLAIEARTTHNLRHVSLLLLLELIRRGCAPLVQDTIVSVIQRADELTELVALYWRNGKCPLSAQMKKGLARAFTKFDAYQLAKYDRDNKMVRLRDVLFLTHAKPRDEAQAAVWKQLINGTLPSPDTWEVALSTGGDKREEFTRLLRENKLGYMALLRNLRNMNDVGVDKSLIRKAILERKGGADRVLPFRFTAAARACPTFERELDAALCATIDTLPPLSGETLILVDVSDSMNATLSGKSDLTRMDAAATLASVINGNVTIMTFSEKIVNVPPRRGMAGVEAIIKSQRHGNTHLAEAVQYANSIKDVDRLIVITDEQATSKGVPNPVAPRAYMINVASYQNGVGYGKWTHIDGFSEAVIKFIYALEASNMDLN